MSHSAFDLMVEFGFSNIALVGQDLAFADNGALYTEDAHLDMSEFRLKALGERFKVKGFYGDDVETNNTFYFLHSPMKYLQVNLKNSGLELFNCTEGGMYITVSHIVR